MKRSANPVPARHQSRLEPLVRAAIVMAVTMWPAIAGAQTSGFRIEEATIADMHSAIKSRADHLPRRRAGVHRAREGLQRRLHGARDQDGAPIPAGDRRGRAPGAPIAFPTQTVPVVERLPELRAIHAGPPVRVRPDGADDLRSDRAAAVRHARRHPECGPAERARNAQHSRRALGHLQGRLRPRTRPPGRCRRARRRPARSSGSSRTRSSAPRSSTSSTARNPDLAKLPMYCVGLLAQELVRREGHARHRRQRRQLRDGRAEGRFAGHRRPARARAPSSTPSLRPTTIGGRPPTAPRQATIVHAGRQPSTTRRGAVRPATRTTPRACRAARATAPASRSRPTW